MTLLHTTHLDSVEVSAPLAPEQRAAYSAAIKQTEAVFALESMLPTAQDRAIDDAILAGRVSPERAREELKVYLAENKTMNGFIESRPWAV